MSVVGTGVRRLNWGCGETGEPGWINSDRKSGPGIDLCCDIRTGLPLASDSIDYVVSIHALPEVPLDDLVQVLSELRRVLRPQGALRLSLPDLERAINAFVRGDRDYFVVPDEQAVSLGGKLITQLLWYGWSRSLFTRDFAEELLVRAGFAEVRHVEFGVTTTSDNGIVALDNRPDESLFIEAIK